MYHVLLYYKITSVSHPEKEVLLQKEVCTALQLKGRILISKDGINGTVGGSQASIALYRAYMDQHRPFHDIDFKESTSDAEPFPKLQVREREEIITTGLREKIDWSKRAAPVDRDTFHQWLKQGEDMVLLDMRNDYEWDVGRFVGSVRPPMRYFRDLKDHLAWYVKEFSGKKIVTFCTGGIRCEPASALLIGAGFDPKMIYQLEGGIVKYAEKYGNDGFYEGLCFVFDDRVCIPVNTSDTAVVVGTCLICDRPSDTYRNCLNKYCNQLFLVCEPCGFRLNTTCSDACRLIAADLGARRPQVRQQALDAGVRGT